MQGGSITIRVGGYKVRGSIKAAGFSIHRNGQKATEYDMSLLSTETCVPLPLRAAISFPLCVDTFHFSLNCMRAKPSVSANILPGAQVLPHVGSCANGHR